MSVSAISFYRGGSVEDVTPIAKKMKAVLRKHGVSYQASRLQTGQDLGDWMVVVTYADDAAYTNALAAFACDPEHRQAVAEISRFVTLVRREMVVELEL